MRALTTRIDSWRSGAKHQSSAAAPRRPPGAALTRPPPGSVDLTLTLAEPWVVPKYSTGGGGMRPENPSRSALTIHEWRVTAKWITATEAYFETGPFGAPRNPMAKADC